MNKGFWMAKGTDRASLDGAPRTEAKRSHQWFVDDLEPEVLPRKKQAVQYPNGVLSSEVPGANTTSWDGTSSFQSVPNQFIQRLIGSETVRTANFSERTCSSGIASFTLSPPQSMVDAEACSRSDGFEKLQTSYFKESDAVIPVTKGQRFTSDSNPEISKGLAFNKEDSNIMPFGEYPDNAIAVGRPVGSYEHSYNQSLMLVSELTHENQLDNANPIPTNDQKSKSKPESVYKTKAEVKTPKKEAPNSFPSNVRSLISTGMLDGVPVKYVGTSRKELHGIIKGTGYLCGCKSCNYNKVVNAYEFERHACSKTKHPNNHIYFENGKTIYQIVQELRSTPESMLFDVVQTCFGAPINQKSFRIWKESFQAATRELQRIYGKEEMNL